MDYKRGLATLRKLAEGREWFATFLIYEARLQENLEQERLYGSSEQYRVTRAQVVDQLNRLAYEHLHCTFNDLCQSRLPEHLTTSNSPARESATQKERVPSSNSTDSAVFISYSRKDGKYLNELRTQLAFYERSGFVKTWDDTRILPGAKWREDIDKAISTAKVAILLVSADFLASDFIARNELPPLLKAAEHKGTTILCVILRPCVFNDTELAQFQTVNVPSTPLSSMSPGKRDAVWKHLAERVKDILRA